MRLVALAATTALVASGCHLPSSTPCTNCPAVAGTYDVVIAPTAFDQANCGWVELAFGRQEEAMRFAQAGNTVSIPNIVDDTGAGIHGTLMEDLSVSFDAYSDQACDPNNTNDCLPITDQIDGKFSGAKGSWRFTGELTITTTGSQNPCSATTSFDGTEVQ